MYIYDLLKIKISLHIQILCIIRLKRHLRFQVDLAIQIFFAIKGIKQLKTKQKFVLSIENHIIRLLIYNAVKQYELLSSHGNLLFIITIVRHYVA